MSTINASLRDSESERTLESNEIRFLAIQVLDLFVRHVWVDNEETVADNLTSIVVALIPVLAADTRIDGMRHDGRAATLAVSLLKWLAEDTRGNKLAASFKNIPFLPPTPSLEPLRTTFGGIGVDFDDLCLTMTEASPSKTSSQSDVGSMSAGDNASAEKLRHMKQHLQRRLETVCPLLGDENAGIRVNALRHLISLLQSTRRVFHMLVESEDATASVTRFLTLYSGKSSGSGRGIVSEVIERLLGRCTLESDPHVRVLVAKALGEVGAIADHRIESRSPSQISGKESDTGYYSWRLSRPPWKSDVTEYQLALLTNHLVAALKAAPSSTDHHKIAFTIQETLGLAHVPFKTGETKADDGVETASDSPGIPRKLRSKLKAAGVLQIVEPFSTTQFCETKSTYTHQPPFFSISSSYYEWLSSWSRYMIHRAENRRESGWGKLLYACRFALRTQCGLCVAEFLLPIIVLDSLCFGTLQDEECVTKEITDALSFEDAEAPHRMTPSERQKAVNAVFYMIDTLRYWSEKDTEDRHRSSSHRNTEPPPVQGAWPPDEAAMRIDDILRAVPLSLQANAAAKTGMHSRSLRFLEMAARKSVVEQVFNASSRDSIRSTRSMAAGSCPVESVDLLKDNLATLGDYETVAALAEADLTGDAMSKAKDAIRQKESSRDWSGALQDYERAQHLTADPKESEELMGGTLKCLLELGQFESVLRQVRGFTVSVGGPHPESMASFAVEAAWRLGRWDKLSELVCDRTPGDSKPSPRNLQVEVGRAMLELHEKNESSARGAIDRAREAVMAPLSAAAQESYSRAYSHIVQLHSLREMEDAVGVICNEASEIDLSTFATDGGGFWEKRLELADSSCAMALMQSRLALARLARNPGLEASLFLEIGRRARKDRQYGIAASALAQAEASFDLVDLSMDSDRGNLLIQLAKLKHETGQTSASLRLLNMGGLESMTDFDKTSLENETLRRVSTMLRRRNHGMNQERAVEYFRKAALLSTKWMIEGGVKDYADIVQRFRTILKVAPNWEKGHFQFAKYSESLLYTRVDALKKKHRHTGDEDSIRRMCLGKDATCQKYLSQAVRHFADSLTLDLKHLFQALPRLLSLWFELSSATIVTNDSEPQLQKLAKELRKHQTELNEHIAVKHKGTFKNPVLCTHWLVQLRGSRNVLVHIFVQQ